MKANIHDLARDFLATEGLKMKDTQKNAIFLFADWVFEVAKAQSQIDHIETLPAPEGCEPVPVVYVK